MRRWTVYRDGEPVTRHYGVIIAGAGAVNPALTAMANAIRVGEHLLARMA